MNTRGMATWQIVLIILALIFMFLLIAFSGVLGERIESIADNLLGFLD